MDSLPKDVLAYLVLDLDLVDIFNLCKTNKNINKKICKNPDFWRNKIIKYNKNNSLIEEAIKYDSVDLFKLLVKPENLNISDIFYYLRYASALGAIDIFEYLHNKEIDIHQNEDEFLRKASTYGKLNMVRYLVEKKNANIKAYNYDALREALLMKRIDIFKYFIEKLGKIPLELKREFLTYDLDIDVREYLKSIMTN
jgi:ankyrin repeat protein